MENPGTTERSPFFPNFITRDFGDGLHLAPQEPTVQFSMTNLETRPNSRVLLVTSVKPELRA